MAKSKRDIPAPVKLKQNTYGKKELKRIDVSHLKVLRDALSEAEKVLKETTRKENPELNNDALMIWGEFVKEGEKEYLVFYAQIAVNAEEA